MGQFFEILGTFNKCQNLSDPPLGEACGMGRSYGRQVLVLDLHQHKVNLKINVVQLYNVKVLSLFKSQLCLSVKRYFILKVSLG
jgi:hypothetical protein